LSSIGDLGRGVVSGVVIFVIKLLDEIFFADRK
jgi:hypothetical protein